MNVAFAAVESRLRDGDLDGAATEFAALRPSLKSSLEGLQLATRIHSAAERWEKVGVLCRVIRAEFPNESFGFIHGAESLHKQGRTAEAIALLEQWNTSATENEPIQLAIAQYRATAPV